MLITLLGSIYSFQKTQSLSYQSTALLEIGEYQKQTNIPILIEPLDTLIQELTINFINQKLGVNSENLKFKKNNKVLQIDFNSPSLATNKEIINRVIIFSEKRHLDLKNNLIQNITTRLEPINKNLKNSNSRLIQLDNILKSLNELKELLLQSNTLENQRAENILNLSLLNQKNGLESQLESLMNQNQSKTQLIGEIKAEAIDSKNNQIILLSFVFGLVFSIVVVFMKDALKTFKERSVPNKLCRIHSSVNVQCLSCNI